MISLTDSDIESLIIVKRREIEKEKSQLGLSPPLEESAVTALYENNKENAENPTKSKQVKFQTIDVLCQRNDSSKHQKGPALDEPNKEFDEHIPPGLERFIRRYIGLPVMLKAGEYSPNNPLVRGERTAGDALLGLGEYERRRNTLRKIRQQQYREYLDQQAKKKQEAKEQAERERREREQREREREERGRELLQERENYTPDRRRSLHQIQCTPSVHTPRDLRLQYVQPGTMSTSYCTNKVDTGIQVDGFSAPLSVAVQTDEAELFQISPQPRICKTQMTQAERELSPRSVHAWPTHTTHETHERRRSYGDFDERTCLLKKCNRDKLTSDLRHSYMPSIFDADAIRLRNMQAEKEAAERRQYYQQELKNQILEQQRIKEERKNREKMLEQAEMRRLEEQLRMLRVAQDREVEKQQELTDAMNESTKEYYSKRSELQREIDMEQEKLLRVSSQPNNDIPKRITNTSQSDNIPSKLPFYYSNIYDTSNKIDTKPYTTNIPENSVFSANYDVDSYLRKNLNFKKDKVGKIFDRDDLESVVNEVRENNKAYCDYEGRENKEFDKKALESLIKEVKEKRTVDKDNKTVEKDKIMAKNASKDKAFIVIKEQDCPNEVIEKQPSKKVLEDIDTLPIPVLRHSLKVQNNASDKTNMSDAMRKVDDKWQIPAVQKNILKAVPNEDGRNVSILTQLGSIRRQLQLEQLRLDKLMSKDNE